MGETAEKFEAWALVEVMGHQRYAGKVTEQAVGGCNFVRVDVPDVPPVNGVGGRQGFTKLLGQSSIFAITPVTEETARRMAARYDNAPVVVFDGRPPQPALPSYFDDELVSDDESVLDL